MWYYESLANQWPAPPWATDSQRFATCNVIMVQFLHYTIINLEPILERFPYRTCFSRFDLALPFLRTAANQRPKAARATDWPTIRSTTLLTADPESVARKSAFSRPALACALAREQFSLQVSLGSISLQSISAPCPPYATSTTTTRRRTPATTASSPVCGLHVAWFPRTVDGGRW